RAKPLPQRRHDCRSRRAIAGAAHLLDLYPRAIADQRHRRLRFTALADRKNIASTFADSIAIGRDAMVHGLPLAIEIRSGDDRYDLECALLLRRIPGRRQLISLPAV